MKVTSPYCIKKRVKMKEIRFCLLLCLLFSLCYPALAQKKIQTSAQWIEVLDNGDATIYYRSDVQKNKKGQHTVWVKTVFHSALYQTNFAQMIGSSLPVLSTKTKALYSPDYSQVMVRQVMCYGKGNRLLYNSGDDASAGWGYADSNDPLSVVGNYLLNKLYHSK